MGLILLALAMTAAPREVYATVTPAATGRQLVRFSLPLPDGMLHAGERLVAIAGKQRIDADTRPLTWRPDKSARCAVVTFPFAFKDRAPVRVAFLPARAITAPPRALPASAEVSPDKVSITARLPDGPLSFEVDLIAPRRTSTDAPRPVLVEQGLYYRWVRLHIPDPVWPRVIDVRTDAVGQIVIEADLQHGAPGFGRAPDLGWRVAALPEISQEHFFPIRVQHPTEPIVGRGKVEELSGSVGWDHRFLQYSASEAVPMQQASWRRATIVISPPGIAPLTAALQSPHRVEIDWRAWDALYGCGPPVRPNEPDLQKLLQYHRDAVPKMMAVGDDAGNVTGYNDGAEHGGAFGMNRLNHCAPMFEEGFRSGDRRLIETALLWCDNFYDQSIWWGPGETGGTRYNNLAAMGQTPPDTKYMWRSNSAVSFCTKGFDAFFIAYEQTGDPRMLEALNAQVAYAAKSLNAGPNYTRNVGCVRDFIRLYRFTGEKRYLNEALRLFRDLRSQLSTGDLFTESGKPIEANPPFIEEDAQGYQHPFAKPYILGYALEGLPELLRYAPNEPKLREVVLAVSRFMAASQDPSGGWRYPHPRSSYTIISQAIEHAWQISQALTPRPPLARTAEGEQGEDAWMDAIERVLRQRVQGWLKTGKCFYGITGWEMATGRVKSQKEIPALYRTPEERDRERDYGEGHPDFGSAPPEGIVYFPELLRLYLARRPAARLLAPPSPGEPLGQLLQRAK